MRDYQVLRQALPVRLGLGSPRLLVPVAEMVRAGSSSGSWMLVVAGRLW